MSTIDLPLLRDDALEAKSSQRQSDTTAIFQSSQQTRTLLLKGSVRWLGTAIFIVFVLVTLKIYESKGNITSTQEVNSNAISTALALGLGLNFFVSDSIQYS